MLIYEGFLRGSEEGDWEQTGEWRGERERSRGRKQLPSPINDVTEESEMRKPPHRNDLCGLYICGAFMGHYNFLHN